MTTPSTPKSKHHKDSHALGNQLDSNKHGTINEITFFEKLKKALRTQQVYENFLKCLALFNQDIITRSELIKLVEPFLGKFSNLYRWFKDYVENSPFNSQNNFNAHFINNNSNLNNGVNTTSYLSRGEVGAMLTASSQSALGGSEAMSNIGGENLKFRNNKNNLLNGGGRDKFNLPSDSTHVHLEIDYLSCKQYGASYRDISAYPQPICSGQTELCKQVSLSLDEMISSIFLNNNFFFVF